MPLITRMKWPPGGWQFFQPETGWSAPQPMADNFDMTVRRIIDMRKANPRFGLSLDPGVVADQLDTFTCYRLNFDPNHCTAEKKTVNQDKEQPSQQHPPTPKARWFGAALVDKVRSIVSGERVLFDWVGSGGQPVPRDQAERRAEVCEGCPKNDVEGDWLTKVTGFIAEAIKEQRTLKTELEITVSNENKLGTCDACGCHLPLKVHVPIKHIERQLTTATKKDLVPYCWILKELDEQR